MVTAIKDISKPGVEFLASVPGQPGKRQKVKFTKEQQQGWVDNFYKMKANGIKGIPAPFVHRNDAAGRPVTEEELSKLSSKDNAGWWEHFWIDPKTEELMGKLEIPLEEDARRIGKTIRAISPQILSDIEDGYGNKYPGEAMSHVAVVTRPIDHKQSEFKIKDVQDNFFKEEVEMALTFLNMADDETVEPKEIAESKTKPVDQSPVTQPPENSEPSGHFASAIKGLQDMGLQLPADTTPENGWERISTAAQQFIADKDGEDEEGSTVIPPGGGTPAPGPSPVALSADAQAQVNKAYSFAAKGYQQTYTDRINALVTSGRIVQKTVKETLMPLVNSYQFELDAKGEPKPSQLDTILELLEAQPSFTQPISALHTETPQQFEMGTNGQMQPIEEADPDSSNSIQNQSDDELQAQVDAQLKNAGRGQFASRQ